MTKRDVLGRRVVAVHQERVNDEEYGRRTYLYSMTLDNGTRIYFQGVETMDTPMVVAHVEKRSKKRTRTS
jgi:hypothetical protein